MVSPCYNHGRFLRDMANSVVAQTFEAWELIIVNDGSTDSTAKIMRELDHENIRFIHMTQNRGPAAARNTGIRSARAPLILNLDADDRIEPTLLERAFQVFENHPGAGIVCSHVKLFGARDGRFGLPPYTLPAMLRGNVIHSTAFFRRADWETVGGYSEAFTYGLEDFDFWLLLIELGREVFTIPEEITCYRRYGHARNSRSGRRTRSRRRYYGALLQVFDRHRELYAREPAVHDEMAALERRFVSESPPVRLLKEWLWPCRRSRFEV